ncbi:MAG TPA: DUF4340 domain-containing protein [Steroidobacter sp.]|nr:DUF4340 domain-containing protein [Steroidobacter sp.]
MTPRTVLTLTIAALITTGAGVWLATRQSSPAGGERALLYPQLQEQLDAVQALRIFKAGDSRTVEIARKDGSWAVSERAGYPADEAKLRKFLRGLAEARVLEEKTSNAKNYHSLGVEDVKEPNAGGVRVELTAAPSAVNLIVGKTGPGARSQYVRRAGEVHSWLIDANLDASASPEAWLRKEILDVSADRIQSASITVNQQKGYTAAKATRADANFTIADLPRGRKPSSPSAANGVAAALAGLTLSDVQPASAFEGAAPAARATFTTFDGLIVQLQGWSRDDKRFLAVQTSYDPQLAERFKVATTPSEKSPDGQEGRKANAAEDAKTTNARAAGWVYEIPSYKYEQIFTPLASLLSS